jgi:hypothetical protein
MEAILYYELIRDFHLNRSNALSCQRDLICLLLVCYVLVQPSLSILKPVSLPFLLYLISDSS